MIILWKKFCFFFSKFHDKLRSLKQKTIIFQLKINEKTLLNNTKNY